MRRFPVFPSHALVITYLLSVVACVPEETYTLITIADARIDKARFIDTGKSGDSVGDILVFDQPLLDTQKQKIGVNSGTCVRTRVGHSFQCQWTLSLKDGNIQVAGRELDQGASHISIVGGTGKYAGITGEMESINNNDGTFTQTMHYRLR